MLAYPDLRQIVCRCTSIAVVLIALVGCGANADSATGGGGTLPSDSSAEQPVNDTGTPRSSGESGQSGDALQGTKWTLVSYGPPDTPVKPVEGADAWLEFKDGQVGGSPGCNHYGARYQLNGQELTFTEGAITEMACAGAGVMEQEQAVLSALNSVKSFELTGDALVLSYDGGQLRFSGAQPASDQQLEGVNWQLMTFTTGGTARSLLAGSQITATFAEGKISGSGGCNSYSADYTRAAEGNSISIGAPISTLMACANNDVTDQEREYFRALGTVKSFTIKGNQLTLEHDGGTLIFTAGAASGE